VADALRNATADFDRLREAAIAKLERDGFSVDYLEIRNASDLSHVSAARESGDRVLLVAAQLGRARLIDNLTV